MRIRTEFYYGSFKDRLEEQANKQGLTLGDNAELLEELKNARLLLRNNKVITESQAESVSQKIHTKLLKSLKVLNNESSKITIENNFIEFDEEEHVFDVSKYLSFSRDEVQNESQDN